jgi:hypothetical protein
MVSQTHCYFAANGGGPKRFVNDAVDMHGIISSVGSNMGCIPAGQDELVVLENFSLDSTIVDRDLQSLTI